jgi:hypothetical protein
MNVRSGVLTTAAAALLTAGVALAQTATPPPPTTQPPSQAGSAATPAPPHGQNIYQRRRDQQQRIANGVQNGSLTAAGTENLESREARINGEIARDKSANGGTLTQQERQQIQRQDNNLSRAIYRDKHNAATAHYGDNEIGKRRQMQQDRIAQGIRSGQLTPEEAARVEGQQRNINQQIAADRRANGGALTPQERRNINRRQNRASRNIYNKRHNGRHRY